MGRKSINLTGKRYGTLVVLKEAGRKWGGALWECQCDCGNIVNKAAGELRRKRHKVSCGCRQGQFKHGLSHTHIYQVYYKILERCCQFGSKDYKYYGGRGIGICDEWRHSFEAFYSWAKSNGYERGLTIDRIDNDGDYSPENCQWITQGENTTKRNRRSHATL